MSSRSSPDDGRPATQPFVVDITAEDGDDDAPPAPLRRRWTPFEMKTVLALICQGHHRSKGGVLSFATHLNEALNRGYHGQDRDVEVEDVEAMLRVVLRGKRAAVAFIERQGTERVTRAQSRAFARSIPFDGSLYEWEVEGRKEREARKESRARGPGAGAGGAADDSGAAADTGEDGQGASPPTVPGEPGGSELPSRSDNPASTAITEDLASPVWASNPSYYPGLATLVPDTQPPGVGLIGGFADYASTPRVHESRRQFLQDADQGRRGDAAQRLSGPASDVHGHMDYSDGGAGSHRPAAMQPTSSGSPAGMFARYSAASVPQTTPQSSHGFPGTGGGLQPRGSSGVEARSQGGTGVPEAGQIGGVRPAAQDPASQWRSGHIPQAAASDVGAGAFGALQATADPDARRRCGARDDGRLTGTTEHEGRRPGHESNAPESACDDDDDEEFWQRFGRGN